MSKKVHNLYNFNLHQDADNRTNLLTRQGGNNDVAFSNQGVITMSKKREDLLAETLDQAGLLAPLMNVMVEQLAAESKATPKPRTKPKKRKEPTVARLILMEHFPHFSEEEIDELEAIF